MNSMYLQETDDYLFALVNATTKSEYDEKRNDKMNTKKAYFQGKLNQSIQLQLQKFKFCAFRNEKSSSSSSSGDGGGDGSSEHLHQYTAAPIYRWMSVRVCVCRFAARCCLRSVPV